MVTISDWASDAPFSLEFRFYFEETVRYLKEERSEMADNEFYQGLFVSWMRIFGVIRANDSGVVYPIAFKRKDQGMNCVVHSVELIVPCPDEISDVIIDDSVLKLVRLRTYAYCLKRPRWGVSPALRNADRLADMFARDEVRLKVKGNVATIRFSKWFAAELSVMGAI